MGDKKISPYPPHYLITRSLVDLSTCQLINLYLSLRRLKGS